MEKELFSKRNKICIGILIALIILTLFFIWGNSFLSKQESGDGSSGIFLKIKPILNVIFYPIFGDDGVTHNFFRKLAHWSEFFFLGAECLMLVISLKKFRWQGLTNVAFFGLIVAVADETIQIFTNRGPAVSDILIDYCGFISALILGTLLIIIVKQIKRKSLSNRAKVNT